MHVKPGGGLTRNGYSWRVAPGISPEAVAPIIESFPDLHALPGVSVLKENQFRTVFRAGPPLLRPPAAATETPAGSLPGAALDAGAIIKAYRYTKGWDRFRYRFLRHRAEQEWVALGRFRAAGLPAPAPLAVAVLPAGRTAAAGGLITGFLAGTAPLVAALQDLMARGSLPGDAAALPGEARSLLLAAGALVRRLHDHGIWHRDLHAGNMLFSPESGALHFIDLHSCYFFRRLARWQRRFGLAKLLVSLERTLPAEGLRLLIEAYGPEALLGGAGLAAAESKLLARLRKLERRRVKSRSKRCFLPSTQFSAETVPGGRLYHVRALRPEDLAPLWTEAPRGRVLKSSPKGWVAADDAGGRRVCVKRRRYTLLESLQSLVESHDLRRAYGGGHALHVRGIAAPQVLALRERRVLGAVREAHLVTELIADGVPLDEHLLGEYGGKEPVRGAAARRKRILARAVGELVRKVHDARLGPHDLSPPNLVVSSGALDRAASGSEAPPFLYWVDLDHLYLWKPLFHRRRRRNLVQVANLPEGHVTAADRLRGLKAYARGEDWCLAPAFRRALERGLLAEHLAAVLASTRRERAAPPRRTP